MLCSEFQLVKDGPEYQDLKPLPCDRWSCEYCAPRRRSALVGQAAAGQPNKILTVTVATSVGDSPNHRRAILHDAWKRLIKRIIRQFAREPGSRWGLKSSVRKPSMVRMINRADQRTPKGTIKKIPYMAFLEKTKRGEPHLHALLRCPFIPQDWIAEQMASMAGSPICWIEEIKGTAGAIRYVTKYVGKAPAQFGNAKRYWVSQGYVIADPAAPQPEPFDMTGIRIQRERWRDWDQHRISSGFWRQNQPDGWVRYWKPGTFGRAGGILPDADGA